MTTTPPSPKPEHVEKANQMVGQAEVAILESRNNMGVNTLVAMNNALVKLRSDIALALSDAEKVPEVARPLSEYHEDFGNVLWWDFPVQEPPYVGMSLDCGFPSYKTHWTPLPPIPSLPAARKDQA